MDQSVSSSKRHTKTIFIVATVLLGGFLSVACCIGLVVVAAIGQDEPLSDAERELLIDPQELGTSLGYDLQANPAQVKYTKNKSLGITTITLEYESPDDAAVPFYLNHELTYEPTVQDARDTFNIGKVVLNQGVELFVGPGAEYVDANDLYTCCDESASQIFTIRDEASGEMVEVGHLFIMRSGSITMTLLYVGPVSHDPQQWRDLLDPHFDAIIHARPH